MSKSFLLLFLGTVLLASGCRLVNQYDPFPDDDDDPLTFPDIIDLPDGFGPEGIVAGNGTDFYVGSLGGGAIYKGDFEDGAGAILTAGASGASAVGLDFDLRTEFLFVAGGATGGARVINTRDGSEVAAYDFGGGFVNDVSIGPDGAYFTDSAKRSIYKIRLNALGIPGSGVVTIPVSDAFSFTEGQFNANGIAVTPLGRFLIVANTFTGELFRIDRKSGEARLIDLGGASVASGDGILLRGRRLFVVQNFLNQISVVDFSGLDYAEASVSSIITNPDFRIPTTVTHLGDELYVVNARFDVAPPGRAPADTEFEVVRVNR